MLQPNQVKELFEREVSEFLVEKIVPYEDIYVFRLAHRDGTPMEYDPFFSYDPLTEEFSDYSVLDDGNTEEIARLFSEEA